MRLFVDACMATELKGFTSQGLTNVVNGEGKGFLSTGVIVYCRSEIRPLPPYRLGQAEAIRSPSRKGLPGVVSWGVQ
jgi:hypothetical protein